MGTTAEKLQKLVDNKQLIIDKVNNKAGTSFDINSKLSDVANAIDNIQSGIDTSDATATTSDILQGKTAYIADGKVEGTIETYSGAMTEGAEQTGLLLEVDSLPSSGGVEGAIYKLTKQFADLYVFDGANIMKLSEGYDVIGTEKVETKPTSNIVSSTMESFYLYYVTSENDIFVYIDIGYGDMWVSTSVLIEQVLGASLSFQGECEEGDELTNVGYYAYMKEEEKYYRKIDNKLTEIDSYANIIGKLASGEEIKRLEYTHTRDKFRANFSGSNIEYLKINITGADPYNKFLIYGPEFSYCEAKTIYLTHNDKEVELEIASTDVFAYAFSLTKLVLDFGSFRETYYKNFLYGTPIADGTGYIYVPDNKVSEVKTLGGYKNFASQIRPLSEYVEE